MDISANLVIQVFSVMCAIDFKQEHASRSLKFHIPMGRSELRDANLVIFAVCAKWKSVLSTSARMIHVAQNALDCKQTLSVPCARLMRNFRRAHRRSDVKSNVTTPQYVKRVKSVDLVLWIPPDTNAVVADAFVDTYSSTQRSLKITKLAIIQ